MKSIIVARILSINRFKIDNYFKVNLNEVQLK